jgi:hypothetical protein
VWLILGPSGAEKSSFGKWLAAKRNWLHLEIDQYLQDGIDLQNLRALQQRVAANSRMSCVLTFSGCLVLPPERIVAGAQPGIRTIYLYGSAAHCITEFLKREQKSGRRLGLDHWISNNYQNGAYIEMSKPALARYRVRVFTHMGTRIPHVEVFETLLDGEQSE